jgi:hypothetical protein
MAKNVSYRFADWIKYGIAAFRKKREPLPPTINAIVETAVVEYLKKDGITENSAEVKRAMKEADEDRHDH